MKTANFVRQLVSAEILQFGEFVTNSGRTSPYFFNTGRINRGGLLESLTSYWAANIADQYGEGLDAVFGPSYKGIPLAVMTSLHLSRNLGRDIGFCFDRKEVKDHGEGGLIVGWDLQPGDTVVVVEDVITGGVSLRKTLTLLREMDVKVAAVVVGIDRQEKALNSELSASEHIAQEFSCPVEAIVTMDDIVQNLHNTEVNGKIWIDDQTLERINTYRESYS